MMPSDAPHVVLVNLGTPQAPTPESVREFLAEFLSDPAVVDLPRWLWLPILHRMVLPKRPHRVAEQYRAIWRPDGSPLRSATTQIAVDLAAFERCHVQCAYRYGEPSLDTAIGRAAGEGTGPIVIVPLFPQRTDATTGTVLRLARAVATRLGVVDRLVDGLIAPDDDGYITALADRWRIAAAAAAPIDHVVVSFHGLPVRYDRREGGRYVRDCRATTAALLAAVGWPAERATLSFQSRFGPERWLAPATADVLERLGRQGVAHLAVIAPGFLTEGLETLEELAIRGRNTFLSAGGSAFTYIPAVEAHPDLVSSLLRAVTNP